MGRTVLKLVAAAAGLVLLAGCGRYSSAVEVLLGNVAYGRGDYQTALVHYMVALEDRPIDAWTRFNTANVYYALGEHEAALELWSVARQGIEEAGEGGRSALSLIFAASYNRGVLLYQQGNYAAAYDEFRFALSVNNGSVDAKANLELALAKQEAASSATESDDGANSGAGGVTAETDVDGGPDEQTLRLLEYVRRKETQQWFATREIESDDRSQDW
jgi:tetratricopeptide (TPR) repeat protein